MNVLVAGAGVLGRRLITRFLEAGHRVKALALRGAEFEGLAHEKLTTIAADVTRPEQIRDVCRDVDLVVSCIGITRISSKLNHMDVDYRGNFNLLQEAERSGVEKFAIVSPEGVDEGAAVAPLLEARFRFEEALRASSVKWVVFHSGGFFSDLAEMAEMARRGPLFVIGSGDQGFSPIDVDDLADVVVGDLATASNEVIHVGGPEALSWNEICSVCFVRAGKRPRIWRIPVWLARSALVLVRPFSERYHAMGRLILFMSTTDLPTPSRRGKRFADYLAEKA